MHTTVNPIPEGYHSLTSYLIMKNADAAIAFYKKAFGAEERFRMIDDGRITHAELKIGDSNVMLADEQPKVQATAPVGEARYSTILLFVEDVDKVFKRAIEGGAQELRSVRHEFYGDRMGTILDPFGHVWHLATHVEDVTPEEMEKRSARRH